MEEQLPGGRNDGAVRIGDTVRRRTGAHTPAVHALLRHLHTVGFHRAPQVLGTDEHGREVLTHLDGETIGGARPWPAWARSDTALIAAGAWLRDFHSASRSFTPPAGAHWNGEHDELRPGELIGHHDAAPYNAVWRAAPASEDTAASEDIAGQVHAEQPTGQLVGFIDFDLAAPGIPLRDLAFTALTWVPLTAHDVAAADGFTPEHDIVEHRGRRLHLLLEAYRWDGGVPAVLDAVRERALEHAEGLRAAAAGGYAPAIALLAEGVADDFERAIRQLATDTPHLLRACC
ncbi:aminoglycoside phosphotransferase family protein [Kineococcus sp. SYSU DK018]|uniref:aminoglycoside phosphotransferase family protein n=1 Tax=Kineococcus sp. SYSU DK018 TaxID=3383139 RepID=UPI003D7EA08A